MTRAESFQTTLCWSRTSETGPKKIEVEGLLANGERLRGETTVEFRSGSGWLAVPAVPSGAEFERQR